MANVDDVFVILHHLWVSVLMFFPDLRMLVQLALVLLLGAYTATRPGAIVYVKRNNEVVNQCALEQFEEAMREDGDGDDNEDGDDNSREGEDDGEPPSVEEIMQCLCYRHITMVLLPHPEGERDLLAVEIDLRFTKGHKRNARRKIFCVYEVDDLIFDPVILIIVLGLLDNAFELEFTSVQQIFQLRVSKHRRSMRIRWKKDWENKPILRQPVQTPDGVKISDTKPLLYHTLLYYLQRLGFLLGSMMILNPYNIRRGAGEGVQEVAPQGQLQQVMGHKDAGIFQAYINERVQCDVQAAFLGRPSEDALFKSLGHMSRDIDPRAPTQLTGEHINELKQHPLIVDLRERRDALSREVRREYGTLKMARAKGSVTAIRPGRA